MQRGLKEGGGSGGPNCLGDAQTLATDAATPPPPPPPTAKGIHEIGQKPRKAALQARGGNPGRTQPLLGAQQSAANGSRPTLSLSQRGSGEQTKVISASGEKLGRRLPRNAEVAFLLGTLEFGLGGAVLEVRKAGGVIFIEVRQTKEGKRREAAAFWK